jgi:hypothetical protein
MSPFAFSKVQVEISNYFLEQQIHYNSFLEANPYQIVELAGV